MPRVEVQTLIRAPVETVYALAKDVERFPEFMPDLETVRLIARDGHRTTTEWVGRVQGRRIRWVEEDTWDDATHTCTFRQREGDFDRYEGVWTFEPVQTGCRTRLVVEFELSIPLLGPLLANLVLLLMRKNAERMLDALRRRAEEGAPPGPEAEEDRSWR
ncbi:MAG: SRPBCC family protein [Armatimonadota bacterium]|nr:SRPBCC family protein [Armatimonadota bacterium]MDR7443323.1 SRPBCC family protein [Armatimonadota bacterium]MDR7570461.1 SRPBCC family protein [Armatimonadota bacterium]MDR7614347.1 SRPBCC family protein [Armatimonadota bacterium]